jgi:hypothetical protein
MTLKDAKAWIDRVLPGNPYKVEPVVISANPKNDSMKCLFFGSFIHSKSLRVSNVGGDTLDPFTADYQAIPRNFLIFSWSDENLNIFSGYRFTFEQPIDMDRMYYETYGE